MTVRPRSASRSAFTLVEMLVVVGVIGLIVGLVVPALASIRAEADSTLCLSNLRQIFTAIETCRHQHKDMLPYAAPLPAPQGQVSLVPGLPERLSGIMNADVQTWFCPADQSDDSQDLGTSYLYCAGAFMLVEPPVFNVETNEWETQKAREERVSRVVTQRYMSGYLRGFPLVADNDGYHDRGSREPWNVIFIDGNARVVTQSDGDLQPPDPPDGSTPDD